MATKLVTGSEVDASNWNLVLGSEIDPISAGFATRICVVCLMLAYKKRT